MENKLGDYGHELREAMKRNPLPSIRQYVINLGKLLEKWGAPSSTPDTRANLFKRTVSSKSPNLSLSNFHAICTSLNMGIAYVWREGDDLHISLIGGCEEINLPEKLKVKIGRNFQEQLLSADKKAA